MPLTQRFDSNITITANLTMTVSNFLVLGNGTLTVTLYTAVGNRGREAEIRNIGTGVVTVKGNLTELVEDANTQTLAAGQAIRLTSDGTQWWKLGSSGLPLFADPIWVSNQADW